jgi:type II secretory ATPase GspE/PulE/Tfp pilus assembly ATPase PilB-like protein
LVALPDVGLEIGPLSSGKRAAVLAHLAERGLVDEASVSRAELISGRTGQPVEQVLNQLGALSDEELADAYAAVLGCPVWDPEEQPFAVDVEALGVTTEFLRRARILPLCETGKTLLCAACDPLDDEALSGLVFASQRRLKLLIARPGDWRREFDQRFDHRDAPSVDLDEQRLEREIDQVAEIGSDGGGGRLVASAFEAAIASGASDIHFEPRRNDLRIRLRIDGRLVDHQVVSADLAGPAVSRVKVIANLDLGEKRLPQDGRTTFVIAGRQIDVRVATSPTVFGESAVLRILDRASVPLDIDALGFSRAVGDTLRTAAKSPHGMFLITGPTGSGKTTTLYALLQAFAGSTKKVLSVEDPVEYHFEHVSQTQVAPHIGLSFATALRSFLRQDPDVILVGEIRDPETAAVAVQAAMTGHFVLASVHANDAIAVLPRMQDMGIEPYQLAAGFKGAAAQRLVRRICPACREIQPLSEAEKLFVRQVGFTGELKRFIGKGCPACHGTGYKGRLAIGEAFMAGEPLLRAIADREPFSAVAEAARKSGLASMAHDGLEKVCIGLTTIEDVMAAVDG